MIKTKEVARITDGLRDSGTSTVDLQAGEIELYLDTTNDILSETLDGEHANSIGDDYTVTHVKNHRHSPKEVEVLVDTKIEEVLKYFSEAQIERLYNKDGFLIGALTGRQQG